MTTRDPPVIVEIIDEGSVQNDGTSLLLSFVDPLAYGAAYLLSGWSVEDEVHELVKMAKSDASPRVKMQAIKTLRSNAVESLLLSGMITKASATQRLPDGSVATFSQNRVTRAAQVASSVKRLPEAVPEKEHTDARPDTEEEVDQEVREEEVDGPEATDHIHKPPEVDDPGTATETGPGTATGSYSSGEEQGPADDHEGADRRAPIPETPANSTSGTADSAGQQTAHAPRDAGSDLPEREAGPETGDTGGFIRPG